MDAETTTTTTAADAIVRAFAAAGTKRIYGVPGGGSSLDLIAAAKACGLDFVLARHETSAVIMAATDAELSGAPGLALCTRGPGVGNAANGMAHAALDRAPVVLLADGFAPAERAFAADVNDMLLERAARIVSACFCAILRRWALPPGSRVCICADGTTFRKNPVLRPKTEAYLRTYAQEALGVGTEFVFLDDATLLGSAWAGLTGES